MHKDIGLAQTTLCAKRCRASRPTNTLVPRHRKIERGKRDKKEGEKKKRKKTILTVRNRILEERNNPGPIATASGLRLLRPLSTTIIFIHSLIFFFGVHILSAPNFAELVRPRSLRGCPTFPCLHKTNTHIFTGVHPNPGSNE